MGNQPERRETRREEIGERLAEIRTRINDLQQAQRESRHPVASGEQLAEAQHHVAFSKASAQQALAASLEAFLKAARAHDRTAISHERAAAAGGSNAEQRRRQAAHHRAAAAADRQRAEAAQSLLSGRATNSQESRQQGDGTAPTASGGASGSRMDREVKNSRWQTGGGVEPDAVAEQHRQDIHQDLVRGPRRRH